MKILVVGGTRFMGKHLVCELIEKGHDVTIANRGITPQNFGNAVEHLKIERSDSENLKNIFSKKHYDIVFDCIAYCSNDVKALLDAIDCEKYIFISTTAVYNKHIDTKEEEFNPLLKKLVWCDRLDSSYNEVKRQAECAVAQKYAHIKYISVRFPFVVGTDDYTKRLYFYIDHILNGKPMFIDNYSNQMAFVRSDEAGKFLAFLAGTNYCGEINGASEQMVSVSEIAKYIKSKTGKISLLSDDGDQAPYNGESQYSINIDRAKRLGFSFTPLKEWIFELIDYYMCA